MELFFFLLDHIFQKWGNTVLIFSLAVQFLRISNYLGILVNMLRTLVCVCLLVFLIRQILRSSIFVRFFFPVYFYSIFSDIHHIIVICIEIEVFHDFDICAKIMKILFDRGFYHQVNKFLLTWS